MQKMIEYMCFRAHYENLDRKEEIPIHEIQERIPPEIVLELWVITLHTMLLFSPA